MRVKVMFFGKLSDIAMGQDEQYFDNFSDTDSLLSEVFRKYPSLKNYTFKIAVNQEVKSESVNLFDKDEIALLPPFAGG